MLVDNFLPDQDVRVVSSGIDTLYIGYDVNVNKEILSLLEEKKAEAKEKEGKFEGMQVTLGDSTFTLRPVGVARYAYVLTNSDLSIWVSSKNGMPYPNVYVCFRSLFLSSSSAEAAVDFVRTLLEENLGLITSEKVSRVDMQKTTDAWRIRWAYGAPIFRVSL